MSNLRDEYLQKHWSAYPEMPKGALKWGRVALAIQHLSELSFKDAPNILARDVLKDGDLVALMPENQIILLAPNLTERLAQSEQWHEHKKWQEFLAQVRSFFREKQFQDVKTPSLVVCPGTEPSLEVFETTFRLDSKTTKYFLPTSPELNLKKMLCEGAEKIFEIASVFRNGEKTTRHDPEFTMLEWYRAFTNLSTIKADVVELTRTMAEQLKVDRPREVLTFSVSDLFKKYCDFDLKLETSIGELKDLAKRLAIDVSAATCIDDYFYLIFIDKIENKWPQDCLVFVEKYPPYQAALARLGSDGWAERFEVYWRGFELGNAFYELNDPIIQKQRALEDLEKKKAQGKTELKLDDNFFSALEFGLPPSSGIAVGLERLYMALTGIREISELKRIF
ncbi:MAG: EF-P lysine aminoacylase EpmA [Bdellovibrionota bacterium]